MDFNTLLTAIATNGIGAACAAAVLWFAWFRETKTIPAMMDTFTRSNTATLESFEKREKRLIESHNDQHEKTLASHERREAKALELFGTLVREERTLYQRWHEENRDRLDAVFSEIKELRHFGRDLANQLGLRKAVEEAQARQKPEPK